MSKEELEELLDVPAETRMDAEQILFVLEEKPDGFNTSVCRIAEQVLGKSLGDDFCYFCTNGLCFELGFELDTGKGGLHPFAEPAIGKVGLSCQNDSPSNGPFEATWNPETQEWSKALPF